MLSFCFYIIDVFVLFSRAPHGQGMLDRLAMAQKFAITEEPLNLVSLQSTYTVAHRPKHTK